MIAARPDPDKTRRSASREARRAQLIEATIRVLAREGYARTTLSHVATEASVSHGLVNFHFTSKELLLSETLQTLAREYRDNWIAALAAAPDDPAAQIDALIRADFDPAIVTHDRISAWCAFWGEAQSRPIYQDHCASNDAEYAALMDRLCARLVSEGGYGADPALVSRVLRVTSEGVWFQLITMRNPYSNDEATRTVLACAEAFFPRHFPVRPAER